MISVNRLPFLSCSVLLIIRLGLSLYASVVPFSFDARTVDFNLVDNSFKDGSDSTANEDQISELKTSEKETRKEREKITTHAGTHATAPRGANKNSKWHRGRQQSQPKTHENVPQYNRNVPPHGGCVKGTKKSLGG